MVVLKNCEPELSHILPELFNKEKLSFKVLGLTFSSKLDWDCYIRSIVKTASKKIGALIRSMKFLSP